MLRLPGNRDTSILLEPMKLVLFQKKDSFEVPKLAWFRRPQHRLWRPRAPKYTRSKPLIRIPGSGLTLSTETYLDVGVSTCVKKLARPLSCAKRGSRRVQSSAPQDAGVFCPVRGVCVSCRALSPMIGDPCSNKRTPSTSSCSAVNTCILFDCSHVADTSLTSCCAAEEVQGIALR